MEHGLIRLLQFAIVSYIILTIIFITHNLILIYTAVDCGDPEEADANGSVDVSDGTTLGSTAVYSCAAGYNLVGSDVVTCTVSGEWSDGAPTCQSMQSVLLQFS